MIVVGCGAQTHTGEARTGFVNMDCIEFRLFQGSLWNQCIIMIFIVNFYYYYLFLLKNKLYLSLLRLHEILLLFLKM